VDIAGLTSVILNCSFYTVRRHLVESLIFQPQKVVSKPIFKNPNLQLQPFEMSSDYGGDQDTMPSHARLATIQSYLFRVRKNLSGLHMRYLYGNFDQIQPNRQAQHLWH
jgi:hypothetical protein